MRVLDKGSPGYQPHDHLAAGGAGEPGDLTKDMSAPPSSDHIRHIDVEALPSFWHPLPAGGLIVFWYRDWPVGQIYPTPDVSRGSFMDVTALMEAAVLPATLERARAGVTLEQQGRPPDDYRLSVVICTRNRADELARCLGSLRHQTRVPDEVIVVDNASTDAGRTRDVAMSAGVRYVREDRPGLDIARNSGAQAAQGDIVAYTDDDVHLHPRWLERLAAAFDRPDLMVVTGLVLPAELATEAQRYFETFWSFARGYNPIEFDEVFFRVDRTYCCPAWEIGAGASMGFRREVFERVGLFDNRLDVGAAGCSGDSEYWHRVLSHGFRCRYEPSAAAYHFHRRDMPDLSRQIRAYMRGHSAALMVQYERTGNYGNLRRAFLTLPYVYSRRVVRGIVRGWPDNDLLITDEIAGFLAGLLFYFRTPRSKSK